MRTIAAAVVTAAVTTACTPADVALFNKLSPDQQARVVHAINHPTDCYGALWHFSGDRTIARQIIWRESRNTPTADNPRSTAAGCWQLLAIHDWRYYRVGCKPSDRYNAVCNTKAADHLYREAGWRPWQ